MRFLNSLFRGGRSTKNDLIRTLAKRRVRQDPTASAMGFDESMVDSLGMVQLAGIPESTIATIVETYATLKKGGVSDVEIFAGIEAHRSSIGGGEMPKPLNLGTYIQYRLELEHSHGAPISEESVIESVGACCDHFGC
jgi:hypothetical protein